MARPLLVSWVLSLALACAGGGSGPPVGQVDLVLGASGASPDWAAIGVTPKQVRFIRADGAPVPVLAVPPDQALANLAQLGGNPRWIASASLPAGTYTGAVVTLGANPGEVALIAADRPGPGFPLAPGAEVPMADLAVQGAVGAPGDLHLDVELLLDPAVAVTAQAAQQLDLGFDLGAPGFIQSAPGPGGLRPGVEPLPPGPGNPREPAETGLQPDGGLRADRELCLHRRQHPL